MLFLNPYTAPRWFHAEDHMGEVCTWIQAQADVAKLWHCLDLFGASGRVATTWIDGGYSAISFDIKLHPGDDLCSQSGFYHLLKIGLQCLGFWISWLQRWHIDQTWWTRGLTTLTEFLFLMQTLVINIWPEFCRPHTDNIAFCSGLTPFAVSCSDRNQYFCYILIYFA